MRWVVAGQTGFQAVFLSSGHGGRRVLDRSVTRSQRQWVKTYGEGSPMQGSV